MKVYHRHDRDDWETPDDLFGLLDRVYHFNLDAAASRENTKCRNYLSLERAPVTDALRTSWNVFGRNTVVFLNPPYSQVSVFCRRAAEQARVHNITVVGLVAARPDTRCWCDVIWGIAEIRFLKGRVRFKGASASAPFPSAIVIWRGSSRSTVAGSWDWKAAENARAKATYSEPVRSARPQMSSTHLDTVMSIRHNESGRSTQGK